MRRRRGHHATPGHPWARCVCRRGVPWRVTARPAPPRLERSVRRLRWNPMSPRPRVLRVSWGSILR